MDPSAAPVASSGRVPRGRRRRGLMTFLPARTCRAPGVEQCAARHGEPVHGAVRPVSAFPGRWPCASTVASGARNSGRSTCLCRWAALGSPRRHRCPTSATRWGIVRRQGPLSAVPDAMGLGLLFPVHEATGWEPTRSIAIAPIQIGAVRLVEPDAGEHIERLSAAMSTAAPDAKKVIRTLSAAGAKNSSGRFRANPGPPGQPWEEAGSGGTCPAVPAMHKRVRWTRLRCPTRSSQRPAFPAQV